MAMTILEQQLFDTCRERNAQLIQSNRELHEANMQLTALVTKIDREHALLREQHEEQSRYVEYLERELHNTGWNPNDKH